MSSIQKTSPPVTWAQRKDAVLLSILVPDCKDLDVKLDSDKVHFSGVSGDEKNQSYETDLDLFAEIDPDASQYIVKDRLVDILLRKKEADNSFWPRLLKGTSKPGWLKIDFNRWKDEEDEGADDNNENDFASMMHKMGGDFGASDKSSPDFEANLDVDSDDEDGSDMPKLED